MADGFTLSLGGLQVRWGPAVDGAVRLDLDGDLDNLSVPALRQALDAVFAAGCSTITFDLARTAFIDSSGLGALVGAWRHCNQQGGTARVQNPSHDIQNLLELTGISRFLLE